MLAIAQPLILLLQLAIVIMAVVRFLAKTHKPYRLASKCNGQFIQAVGLAQPSNRLSYGRDAARDQVTSVTRQLTTQARTAFLNVSADSYRVAARQQAVKSAEAALAATSRLRCGYTQYC